MQNKSSRVLLTINLILSLALIIIGAVLTWKALTSYQNSIIKEQDSKLYNFAESTDRNIQNVFSILNTEANSSILQSEITSMRQKAALETEDYSALKRRMRVTTLAGDELVNNIVVRNRKKTLISTAGSTNYIFPEDSGQDRLRMCTDKKGEAYLVYEVKNGKLIYDALLDAEKLYEQIAGENYLRPDRIMFADINSNIAIYRRGLKVELSTLEEISSSRKQELDFIAECEKTGKNNATTINTSIINSKISNEMRMAVIPCGMTGNRVFSIGITTDFDSAVKPMRMATRKMTLFIIVTMLGILMLVICILLMRRETIARDEALKELEEKNCAMAELNRQMQMLAHHQRLETIGTMTSGIAHEFNNLLTPVMGYSIMALESIPEDSVVYDNLVEIYDSSRKAKEIIERLSEISRKGDIVAFKDVNIDEIISKSIQATKPAHKERIGIKFEPGIKGVNIKGDPTQLQQMLMNLILNAIQAIGEKGLIRISSSVGEEGVAVNIADTGSGISKDAMAHIFDPFFTTKESGKGTGLGLAITQRIMEAHNGKIYVDSQEGRGTEFRLVFPAVEESHDKLVSNTADSE